MYICICRYTSGSLAEVVCMRSAVAQIANEVQPFQRGPEQGRPSITICFSTIIDTTQRFKCNNIFYVRSNRNL